MRRQTKNFRRTFAAQRTERMQQHEIQPDDAALLPDERNLIAFAAAALSLNAPAAPAVERAIEVHPFPAIFLATTRGKAKSASVDVVGRQSAPLELTIAKPPSEGVARLEGIEPGHRYRVIFSLGAEASAGRRRDRIDLTTSDPLQPVVRIPVLILVRERVHTFPDTVDLGSVRLRDVRAAGRAPNALSQTLMVYQEGGRDFRVEVAARPDGVDVRAERGPHGDRVQLTVSLDARKAKAGRIEGALELATNDPDFPRLRIAVRGTVLAD